MRFSWMNVIGRNISFSLDVALVMKIQFLGPDQLFMSPLCIYQFANLNVACQI